jgi:hypothetical protein
MQEQPDYVTRLQDAYGEPGQAAFGSAVFHDKSPGKADLAGEAIEKYRYFVGDLWDRYGESAWMAPWKEVYVRDADARPDIQAELRAIADPDARNSVLMILEMVDGGKPALSVAFDDASVTELCVFTTGDGAAMSGLVIAARRALSGEDLFLVFLMD